MTSSTMTATAPSASSAATDAAPQDATQAGDTRPARVTLLVCTTCREADGSDARPRPGERLLAATEAANDGSAEVAGVECLGNCKRRLSAGFIAEGGWTYVFGDLTEDNAADLIEGARLLSEARGGVMPWRGRPQCLKSGMVSRIPPLPGITKRSDR